VPDLKEIHGIPDYGSIIELINAEWPAEFGDKTDMEKIADMNESHNTEKDCVKYLYENNVVIGFYRYSLWPRDARETDAAHTYDIAVLPSRQQQGFGMMLMTDMIESCRSQGLSRLLSRTFKNNTASIALHKKCGFHEHMTTEDSIVWEISLNG